MSTFKITSQEGFEECLMWVSDLYKDVNGIRPRGFNFQNWSRYFNSFSEKPYFNEI